MKSVLFLFLILATIGLMVSCYNDNLAELDPSSSVKGGSCDTTGIMSYANHIAPLLRTNCGTSNSCHNSNNTSGFNLSTYAGVYSTVANGKLISSITWTGSATRMPEATSKMNDCKIATIQKWIDAGALDN
jgi:hypothetical protein